MRGLIEIAFAVARIILGIAILVEGFIVVAFIHYTSSVGGTYSDKVVAAYEDSYRDGYAQTYDAGYRDASREVYDKGYNKGYQTQQLDVVNKNWINNTGANSQKDYIPLKIRKCVKVPAKEVNGIVYEEHEECFDVYK